ncbi:MAG: hypothetical protein KAQ64_04060 [Candidatus Pacebacteria bacterium]|nr:hypothetical protein [Candidatus Paceibacterota bacterium]
MATIYDVLIGKWIEKRNENKKLKREIYFEANRALSRYKDIYITTPFDFSKNMSRLHEQQMLLEAAKADLEIIGSDEAVDSYVNCLKLMKDIGEEVSNKKQEGEANTTINIKELSSYNDFLDSWRKWNNIVRKDLGIIK